MKPSGDYDPGFRMSEMDVGFLLLAFAAAPLLGRVFEQLTIAALFAVFHFFLFCNILRARRSLELLWAASFVALWSSSYFWDVPSWSATYSLAFAVTVVVSLIQVRLPSYHGVFWTVLNPKLPQWWEKRTGRKV